MYTGRTSQPCCLCGDPDADREIAVPPRAVELMENGDPIAWRDVVGPVTLYFCESDWETVRDVVLEMDMHPLGRCNAARADMDFRADHEALLNATREAPDQTDLERRMLADARATLADDDPMTEDRDRVEARVVDLALRELGVADDRDAPRPDGA